MKFLFVINKLMLGNIRILNSFILIVLMLSLSSCFGPKNMFLSGKVTPKGCFTVGANATANISTSGVTQAYKTAESIANQYASTDSVVMDDQLNNLSKTAIAYTVDPISAGYDFYIRYGIAKKFDVGYRFNNGANVFDARYQFLGTTGNAKDNEDKASEKLWHGSFGLQYSSQSSGIPYDYFGVVSQQFNFNLSRKDIVFPVTFSFAFGSEEKYGAMCIGMVVAHTNIKYSFNPQSIYQLNQGIPQVLPAFDEDKNFISGGAFTHIKFGYKYVYGVIGAALYYQNFGTFKTLNQSTFNFKGFTFVPNAGIIITTPSVIKKKK